jgi:hypothetical protein
MKIQEFCSKIRDDKNGMFQTLRRLQKIETRILLDDGLEWDPWSCVATTEPASA